VQPFPERYVRLPLHLAEQPECLVLLHHQLFEVMADQLGGLESQGANGGGTGVRDDAGLVDHGNAVVAILDERSEPALVLAQRFGGSVRFADVEVHHHRPDAIVIEGNRRGDHVKPADGAGGIRSVHPLESRRCAGENRLETVAHTFVRRAALRAGAPEVEVAGGDR
jgi:hypothetical protein